MVALDFPNSPTVGQVFSGAGTNWTWDGAKWVSKWAGGNAYTTTSADFTVPPVGQTIVVNVVDASWIVVGQMVWVAIAGGGSNAGPFRVTAKSGNQLTLLNPVTSQVSVPVSFSIAGRPSSNMMVHVPVSIAMTIASGLAGTIGFANTAATAAAAFILNKISGGSTTQLGTITAPAGSKTGFTLAGAGGSLAIGDVLQLVAPTLMDTTLTDVGITLLAQRA